jgi:hypothetical protein
VEYLDLQYLQCLTILGCSNVQPLLASLATSFRELQNASLRSLIIHNLQDTNVSEYLRAFVEVLRHLEFLQINLNAGDILGVRSLIGCGQNIKKLYITHTRQNYNYTSLGLLQLVSSCPNLTHIGVSLIDLSHTIDTL